MKLKGPFNAPPNHYECISKAIRENRLELLEPLFDDIEFTAPISNEVNNFFLEYSNDACKYDLLSIQAVLARLNESVFMPDGSLNVLVSSMLPKEALTELSSLIKQEINKCFELVFDNRGQLQSWAREIFPPEQFTILSEQFGITKLKFKILHLLTTKHSQRFQNDLSPADRQCSDVLIALIQHEMICYLNFSNAIAKLDNLLSRIGDGYKSKKTATLICQQADEFFFSNRFLAKTNIKNYIEKLSQVIDMPHSETLVNELKALSFELEYKTENNYLLQFIGTVSVFIGAFLIVAGSLNVGLLPISAALVTSGLLFFGSGVTSFQAGIPKNFSHATYDFNEQAKNYCAV